MTRRLVVLLPLLLAAGPAPSRLDQFAASIAAWVADDGPVAIHVAPRTPALAPMAELVAELVATKTGAGRVGTAREAREQNYAHFVPIEIGTEGAELQAFGKIVVTGRDLWAELGGERPLGVLGTFVVRVKLDDELRAVLGPAVPARPVAGQPSKVRQLAFRALGAGLDLGAPLLDLAAADLDQDGKAEVVALTTDEVVVLTVGPGGARPVARAPLEGAAPVPRPRFPVGTLVVADLTGDGHAEIVARSSEHATTATFVLAGGLLVRAAGATKGFPLCADAGHLTSGLLVPGLHLFGKEGLPPAQAAPLPARFTTARCGGGLLAVVDAQGTLRLFRAGGRPAFAELPGAGTAVALVDLDGDGAPELATSAHRAPGSPDAVTLYTVGDSGVRPLRRGAATPGGVIAIAAGDLDGDGAPDVLAASRAAGTQVDLWLAD